MNISDVKNKPPMYEPAILPSFKGYRILIDGDILMRKAYHISHRSPALTKNTRAHHTHFVVKDIIDRLGETIKGADQISFFLKDPFAENHLQSKNTVFSFEGVPYKHNRQRDNFYYQWVYNVKDGKGLADKLWQTMRAVLVNCKVETDIKIAKSYFENPDKCVVFTIDKDFANNNIRVFNVDTLTLQEPLIDKIAAHNRLTSFVMSGDAVDGLHSINKPLRAFGHKGTSFTDKTRAKNLRLLETNKEVMLTTIYNAEYMLLDPAYKRQYIGYLKENLRDTVNCTSVIQRKVEWSTVVAQNNLRYCWYSKNIVIVEPETEGNTLLCYASLKCILHTYLQSRADRTTNEDIRNILNGCFNFGVADVLPINKRTAGYASTTTLLWDYLTKTNGRILYRTLIRYLSGK